MASVRGAGVDCTAGIGIGVSPPKKERPGGSHAARPFQKKPGPHQVHQQPIQTYNTQHRQGGRYADAWRHGFGHGFRDALRLAARELPVETWATLDALAERYELAGADV